MQNARGWVGHLSPLLIAIEMGCKVVGATAECERDTQETQFKTPLPTAPLQRVLDLYQSNIVNQRQVAGWPRVLRS